MYEHLETDNTIIDKIVRYETFITRSQIVEKYIEIEEKIGKKIEKAYDKVLREILKWTLMNKGWLGVCKCNWKNV